MFGRIADAITTRLLPHMKAEIRAQLDARDEAGRREVRELVREMEDVLEKLTLQAARESKRRSREAKAALQPTEEEAMVAEAIHQPPAISPGKAQLYQQYGHMLHRRQ